MISYPGTELELFRLAKNWKDYWSSRVRPLVVGSVAEIGAGLGENVPLLLNSRVSGWTCVEPDPKLAERIERFISNQELSGAVEVFRGTLDQLPEERKFDTILYIDVLEHIQADAVELARAASQLRTGGRLVVLAPAHPCLFSPFDASIGHYRRYSRRSLLAAAPRSLSLEWIGYLDSVGLLASAGNKLVTRRSMPSARQILFWDRALVPASRLVDRALGGRVGKSVLAIWRHDP